MDIYNCTLAGSVFFTPALRGLKDAYHTSEERKLNGEAFYKQMNVMVFAQITRQGLEVKCGRKYASCMLLVESYAVHVSFEEKI